MTDDKIVLALILVVSAACVALGLASGINIGHNEGCSSLQLEWVKDRCMKVTREEVK